MTRRKLIGLAVAGSVQASAGAQSAGAAVEPPAAQAPFRFEPFPWEEATIADLSAAMNSGKASADSLTKDYLARIEALDRQGPSIRAVMAGIRRTAIRPESSTRYWRAGSTRRP